MKYNDSILQANKKMALVVQLLDEWSLPINPLNYTIAYHYLDKSDETLIKDIDNYLKIQQRLDNFFLEELFRQHILCQSKFRDDLVEDLDKVLSAVSKECKHSSSYVDCFLSDLDDNIELLKSKNSHAIKQSINNIYKASNLLKVSQLQVAESIVQHQEETAKLKAELDEIRQELFMDPLTGLYNKKALDKHIETWISENPGQHISAIVINIDHFNALTKKFGQLLGNVLLSKVAKKVSSYVGESGLPVRSGNEEFLILLPGVEKYIASEIAEKIRQGVERLRFINSKTGMRLPAMTISLGVNEFKINRNIQGLLASTRVLIKQFQQKNQNKVVTS